MKTSPLGIAHIKRWEGLRTVSYRCPGGAWTVGYGHTATARPGMRITEAEAERLLLIDLKVAEEAVQRLVTVPLTQGQFDALVSFVFNMGAVRLRRSTLLRRLNRGEHAAVPDELRRWVYTRDPDTGQLVVERGLVNRREAEVALWNT